MHCDGACPCDFASQGCLVSRAESEVLRVEIKLWHLHSQRPAGVEGPVTRAVTLAAPVESSCTLTVGHP